MSFSDDWINRKGRPKGKMPKTQIRDELNNAVRQVVKASAEGDVNASIAVLEMARAYDIK